MTILSSFPRIMFGLSSNHAPTPFYWRSNPRIFGSNLELRAAEISGARNVAFFNTKCVAKMGGVSSPKRRVRDDNFFVGLPSDILGSWSSSNRLSIWQKQVTDFWVKS